MRWTVVLTEIANLAIAQIRDHRFGRRSIHPNDNYAIDHARFEPGELVVQVIGAVVVRVEALSVTPTGSEAQPAKEGDLPDLAADLIRVMSSKNSISTRRRCGTKRLAG